MLDETFFRRWLEGEMSDDEVSRIGRKAFDDDKEWYTFKKIVDGSQGLKPPENKTREEAWSHLVTKIDSRPSLPDNPETVIRPLYKKKIVKYLSVAAAIIIIFGVYSIFSTKNPTIYETAMSEIKTITMPDHSLITLNADSKLSFVEGNWTKDRSVSLEGEAFFDVKKGTKFEVNSEVGKVTVLGTSFNVKARKERYEVACFTGKVAVSLFDNQSEKVLSDGLATKIMNRKLLEPFDFKPESIAGWKYGEYYFEKQPLKEVFEEFERQFNLRVKINTDIRGRVYSGYFNKEDKANALELICLPMNLQFAIQNDTVIIY